MFVDSVSFCVLQWISCVFVKFAPHFHWFYGISLQEKYSILQGISQSDSGAMVLAHESGYFAELLTSVWLHLCQGLACQRHEEISVLHGFPAPWPRPDICPDGLVGR